jgi:C4-type Zn-finger protein
MPVEPRCPVCRKARGRIHRVTTVPGYKDVLFVDTSCESCAHEWRSELQLLFITDDVITGTTKAE